LSIQNIIFDLGGVLIEWNPAKVVHRFTTDPKARSILMQEIFKHPDWAEKDRGGILEAEAIARFAQRTGFPETKIKSLMVAVNESLELKEDTFHLLNELFAQGYPLYCLSNLPGEHYAHLRSLYEFWDKFEGIVISGFVKMVKPEPEIYQYILDAYHLEPSTCIFIDDSPRNIEVARLLGINGIVFTDAQSCRQHLNTWLKNDYSEQ